MSTLISDLKYPGKIGSKDYAVVIGTYSNTTGYNSGDVDFYLTGNSSNEINRLNTFLSTFTYGVVVFREGQYGNSTDVLNLSGGRTYIGYGATLAFRTININKDVPEGNKITIVRGFIFDGKNSNLGTYSETEYVSIGGPTRNYQNNVIIEECTIDYRNGKSTYNYNTHLTGANTIKGVIGMSSSPTGIELIIRNCNFISTNIVGPSAPSNSNGSSTPMIAIKGGTTVNPGPSHSVSIYNNVSDGGLCFFYSNAGFENINIHHNIIQNTTYGGIVVDIDPTYAFTTDYGKGTIVIENNLMNNIATYTGNYWIANSYTAASMPSAIAIVNVRALTSVYTFGSVNINSNHISFSCSGPNPTYYGTRGGWPGIIGIKGTQFTSVNNNYIESINKSGWLGISTDTVSIPNMGNGNHMARSVTVLGNMIKGVNSGIQVPPESSASAGYKRGMLIASSNYFIDVSNPLEYTIANDTSGWTVNRDSRLNYPSTQDGRVITNNPIST